MTGNEQLVPNYEKLDVALRAIGYSFEVAVADIVDNSIDATRTSDEPKILVRLPLTATREIDLAIWDNGCGMDSKLLQEAMRFGADVSSEEARLGKFGLGLKLASLSQARALHVVSRRDGHLVGRAWLEDGIARGFSSTIYEEEECKALLAKLTPDIQQEASGTLVWWSGLYRIGNYKRAPEEYAQKLMRRLQSYLALAFHRYLSGKARKVTLSLDIFDQASNLRGIPIDLDPLDPFGYDHSGRKEFPLTMVLSGRYQPLVNMTAHIWPPNSNSSGYKLPGGVASRQGFYFYRNNRLIQAGGWNGMRESEPHLSLARIEVDLDPKLDVEVSLDVRKVEIQLPLDLTAAIERSSSQSGVEFKKYIALAQENYRKRSVTETELPLIPSRGLPAPLATFLQKELRIKATRKFRKLSIRWKRLEKTAFFDLDKDTGCLFMNSFYRRQLMHGLPGSAADMPVLKCLLFFAAEEAMSSDRIGPRMRDRLELINRVLIRAVKFERTE